MYLTDDVLCMGMILEYIHINIHASQANINVLKWFGNITERHTAEIILAFSLHAT